MDCWQESDEEILDDDDFDAPAEYKTLNVFLSSLRMDNVVGAGLGVARKCVYDGVGCVDVIVIYIVC